MRIRVIAEKFFSTAFGLYVGLDASARIAPRLRLDRDGGAALARELAHGGLLRARVRASSIEVVALDA